MHRYVKKPENIRQIGESPYSGAIYIEDYVMTYIRRIFKDEGEEKIILLLGKKEKNRQKVIYLSMVLSVWNIELPMP